MDKCILAIILILIMTFGHITYSYYNVTETFTNNCGDCSTKTEFNCGTCNNCNWANGSCKCNNCDENTMQYINFDELTPRPYGAPIQANLSLTETQCDEWGNNCGVIEHLDDDGYQDDNYQDDGYQDDNYQDDNYQDSDYQDNKPDSSNKHDSSNKPGSSGNIWDITNHIDGEDNAIINGNDNELSNPDISNICNGDGTCNKPTTTVSPTGIHDIKINIINGGGSGGGGSSSSVSTNQASYIDHIFDNVLTPNRDSDELKNLKSEVDRLKYKMEYNEMNRDIKAITPTDSSVGCNTVDNSQWGDGWTYVDPKYWGNARIMQAKNNNNPSAVVLNSSHNYGDYLPLEETNK
jgi:hypothetical protein